MEYVGQLRFQITVGPTVASLRWRGSRNARFRLGSNVQARDRLKGRGQNVAREEQSPVSNRYMHEALDYRASASRAPGMAKFKSLHATVPSGTAD
jgi:hypothetical protein